MPPGALTAGPSRFSLALGTAGLLSAGLAVVAAAAIYYKTYLQAAAPRRRRRRRYRRRRQRGGEVAAQAGAGAGHQGEGQGWLHFLAAAGADTDAAQPALQPRVQQQQAAQRVVVEGGEPPRGGEHVGAEAEPEAEAEDRGALAGGWLAEVGEGPEVPEAFMDPITFAVMDDPVVLCGTGQVYNYPSLRAWLSTGQRKCPKTNLALVDIEVVRLPLLRHAIHAWMQQHLMPIPAPEVTPEALAAADARCPGWFADLRCGDVPRRGTQAAAKINNALIEWGRDEAAGEELKRLREAAMEYMMDDLVWLLRHGDKYGQGVACAALAQYHTEAHRQWLAAVAAIPACALLASPNDYARHAAARLLWVLLNVHPSMAEVVRSAGAVPGLLLQVDLSRPFPYSRCSAARALQGVAVGGDSTVREAIRKGGGVGLLIGLVVQDEEDKSVGAQNEQLVRFDKRDAAAALLELDVMEEELEGSGLTLAQLRALKKCSRAWLFGRVAAPDEGYTAEELAALEAEAAAADSDAEAEEGEDAAEGAAEDAAEPAAADGAAEDAAAQGEDEGVVAAQEEGAAGGEAGVVEQE